MKTIHTSTNQQASLSEPVRFNWIEIFRGIAILEVLTHHVSGKFLRVFEQGSLSHSVLAWLNQSLHFAVPGFLFLTTLVLGNAVVRKFDAKRYFKNRIIKVLWPYLLWSIIFLLWRTWFLNIPYNPESLIKYITLGKSYFHLYFLAISLQLTVLVPLLLPLLRRSPSFPAMALGGLAVQVLFYLANKQWWHMYAPASFVTWYIPSIALGIWAVGASRKQAGALEGSLHKYAPWIALSLLAAAVWFLPVSVKASVYGQPVNTMHYQVGHWLYTGCATLLLVWGAMRLAGTKVGKVFKFIGTFSLQIYLIHPLIMSLFDNMPNRIGVLSPWVQFGVYMLACFSVPLGVALLLRKLKLSEFVFGR